MPKRDAAVSCLQLAIVGRLGAIVQLGVAEQLLGKQHGLPRWIHYSDGLFLRMCLAEASHRIDQKLSKVTASGKSAYPAGP